MSICNIKKEAADGTLFSDPPCQQAAKVKNRTQQHHVNRTVRGRGLLMKFNKQKVQGIRRQIKDGDYDFDGKFDIAMDRVLELLLE
jgi:hypothetical protein